jgi:hypothetical protein
MRNILVFPDGTEQDFMYPPNRDIEVGETLVVHMLDDSIQIMKVTRIEKKEREIRYYLALAS